MSDDPGYGQEFYDMSRRYYAKGLPAFTKFALEQLKVTSLVDFGCGQGDWLRPFVGVIPVMGYDGYADEKRLRIPKECFRKLDLGHAKVRDLFKYPWDTVMSLEAMEHVAHEHEANYLDCLLACKPRLVLLSVGAGQGIYDPNQFRINKLGEKVYGGPDWKIQWGRHHVNCQPVSVVVQKMFKRGYKVDERLSAAFGDLRQLEHPRRFALGSFYRRNGRVYRRR